jgi:hypothetical protein
MTIPPSSRASSARRHASMRAQLPRLLAALLAGFAASALLACSSSTKGLIPASNAGPLQSDFETVQQAAENGDGDCTTTEAALLKTNEDLAALPTTVDAGLRSNLRQGVANLSSRARALCAQPLPQTTATDATLKPTTTATTPTPTTPTTTTTTTTPTTPTTTTTPATPTTPNPGGGTPAPGESETPPGAGNEQGEGNGNGAGGRAGGAGAGEDGGGAGGQ